jgi:hypothetical protein
MAVSKGLNRDEILGFLWVPLIDGRRQMNALTIGLRQKQIAQSPLFEKQNKCFT